MTINNELYIFNNIRNTNIYGFTYDQLGTNLSDKNDWKFFKAIPDQSSQKIKGVSLNQVKISIQNNGYYIHKLEQSSVKTTP